MKRRYLLAVGTACAVPFGLAAQMARKARLALVILVGSTADTSAADGNRFLRAFFAELRRLSYSKEGNLAVA